MRNRAVKPVDFRFVLKAGQQWHKGARVTRVRASTRATQRP
jgi:hypothetical protein